MPDYAGLIKYPTGSDIYGGGNEPQWWKDLATTAAAEAAHQASSRSPVGHTHDDRYYTEAETDGRLAGKVDTTDPRLSDARTPTAHEHSTLTNGTFSADLSSAGAFALRSGSSNTVQWNAATGNLVAGNVPWERITGAPSTTPTAWADVTGKPTEFPSSWALVSGKPSTFTPAPHEHDSINQPGFEVDISTAGAFAGRAGGSNTLQFDLNTGRMIAGIVPWGRLVDVPVEDWADAITALNTAAA